MKSINRSMTANFRWISIIFIAIGLLGILIGLIGTPLSYMSNQRFMETAISTEAVISNIDRYRGSDETHYKVYLTYHTEDGKEYESPINFYSSNMYVGKTMTIFYNPDNPHNITVGGSMGGILIFLPVIIGGSIGLIFLVIGIITLRLMGKSSKNIRRLMENGYSAMADVMDVTHAINILINGQHPYVLRCQYTHQDGQTYILKSEYLSYDPQSLLLDNKVKIWFNPNDYTKYYVDVEGSVTTRLIEL